jgi:hypothetical protein
MRLTHHLVRHRSGVFHFRLIVPTDLRERLQRRVLKRSLRTCDPHAAQASAWELSAGYARVFAMLRRGPMPKSLLDEALAALTNGSARHYERDSSRGYVKTDSPEDHARLMDYVQAEERLAKAKADASREERAAQQARSHADAIERAAQARLNAPRDERADAHRSALEAAIAHPQPAAGGKTLREAINHWETVEKDGMSSKAAVEARQKEIESFAEHVGEKRPIANLTRLDVASWVAYLRGTLKNTKNTAKNKAVHIKALFECASMAGIFPHKENPAEKAVAWTKREQAERAKTHGWQAFTEQQLRTLFNPDHLKLTREIHTRRAMVIALYTGARVGEIAQLRLNGFKTIGNQPVMTFQGELKTEASQREIPIHSDLIRLGLLEWVEDQRRRGGLTRLFPTVKLDGKSGKGNAISKGLSGLLDRLKIEPTIDPDLALTKELDPKLGMHSFRDTLIQAMQGGHTHMELRKAYVGHKNEGHEKQWTREGDSHETAYMRKWKPEEIARVFAGIHWDRWLDFDGLRKVLAQTDAEHAEAMRSMKGREQARARTAARNAAIEAETAKPSARRTKKTAPTSGAKKMKPA